LKPFRSLVKDLLPPMLTRALRKLWPRYGFFGDYPTWDAAVAAAHPYETDFSIYGPIAESIRRGEQEPGLTFLAVLSGILLAGDCVRVLDFGGGLGVGYLRIARAIPDRIDWWRVVELPPVVEYGRTHFADGKLSFFTSVDEALVDETPDVLLCGAIIHCLENPYDTLAMLLRTQPRILILDRVPLHRRERIMVSVRPEGKSMPIRILADNKLDRVIEGYELIGEHYIGSLELQNPTLADVRYVARLYRRIS
jgi:putative methyltransferase (TIGR04325 family)